MQLLKDKIRLHGLTDIFQETQNEIRGPFESLIIFKGLQGNSAQSLKSLEGYSRAWVEEAQSISYNSLELMTPTFRRSPSMDCDPEMYFTWNPYGDDDPVEILFDGGRLGGVGRADVIADPDFVCVTVNYRDNPWFPADLRRDMERDKRRDPDKYAHVWLGEYQKISEARVFKNFVVQEFDTPEDVRFHLGADWGFSVDPSVCVRCYTQGRALFIDHEAYKVGCPIDMTPALFMTVPESTKWPMRADSARPETIDYMKRHGFPQIVPAVKGKDSVKEGVEFLKTFDIIIHPRCERTIDEFSKYAYKVDKRTNEVLPVLADMNNNVIDACRYALEAERRGPAGLVFSDEMVAALRNSGRSRGRMPGSVPQTIRRNVL